MKAIEIHITDWLRNYHLKSGTKGFVVGISGGIDSAVTSTLCALTGAPVLVVDMPIHQKQDQVNRGQEHIDWLLENFKNVSHSTFDLTGVYDAMKLKIDETKPTDVSEENEWLTLGNTRSRLRMTTLYALAGNRGMLVAGTGNKVEDFGVGFYTKYGDGGVDLSPIADLYKTEVYKLGAHLGICESILYASPTDGLFDDDRTDEDQIGATYAELEDAMKMHDLLGDQLDREKFDSDRAWEVWNIYIKRHKANLHKMNPIPVCDIPTSIKKILNN